MILVLAPTIGLLALSVLLYGADSSQGANQIALMLGAVIASVIGVRNGHAWKRIEETMGRSCSAAHCPATPVEKADMHPEFRADPRELRLRRRHLKRECIC